MMEYEDLNQTAVLWLYLGYFNASAQPVVDTENPVEIDCRWEEMFREVLDASGNKVISEIRVYVDRVIPVHSQLRLGTIEDLSGTGTGTAVDTFSDVMQVISYKSIPDIDAVEYRRYVDLVRFGDAPGPGPND